MLALPAGAQASSVGNLEVITYRCEPFPCVEEPAAAGKPVRMVFAFDLTSELQDGDTVTLQLSAGTFSNGTYWLDTETFGSTFSAPEPAVFSNANRTVTLTAQNFSWTIPPGTRVEVQAGFTAGLVNAPTEAGSYSAQVSTSRDTEPVSAPFEVVAGPPAKIEKLNDDLSAPLWTEFYPAPQVQVADAYDNPVPNADVTFLTPPVEPRGVFPPPSTVSFDAKTDADGVATAQGLRAGLFAGSWVLDAETYPPDADEVTTSFDMENVRVMPTKLELALVPPQIEADGVQKSKAVVTLSDDEDRPAVNEYVSISVDGQPPQQAEDLLDGTYELELPPRTKPGEVEVKAEFIGVDPPLQAVETLIVNGDRKAPRVRITRPPKLKGAKATFRFRSPDPDVARFECKLDRKPWRSCKSPKAYRVSRGRHTFRVRAIDLAGNRGKPEKTTFKRVKRR